MPTADERLRHVTLKLKRANEHVAELERQLRAFLESKPYKVGTKEDRPARQLVYYVTSVEPTPDCLPLIAGDAIQNLIGALDHLAFQLVSVDTNDNPPNPRGIYFPIAEDVAKYDAKKGAQLAGAHPDTFAAIDALRPYKGGTDDLWTLQALNNIEKHRLLLTVGSQAGGVNIGDLVANVFGAQKGPEYVEALQSIDAFLLPADKGFPLTPGFHLFLDSIDHQPIVPQRFRFNVALNEPGIIEGQPLLDTLQQFTALVERVAAALAPRLTAP